MDFLSVALCQNALQNRWRLTSPHLVRINSPPRPSWDSSSTSYRRQAFIRGIITRIVAAALLFPRLNFVTNDLASQPYLVVISLVMVIKVNIITNFKIIISWNGPFLTILWGNICKTSIFTKVYFVKCTRFRDGVFAFWIFWSWWGRI